MLLPPTALLGHTSYLVLRPSPPLRDRRPPLSPCPAISPNVILGPDGPLPVALSPFHPPCCVRPVRKPHLPRRLYFAPLPILAPSESAVLLLAIPYLRATAISTSADDSNPERHELGRTGPLISCPAPSSATCSLESPRYFGVAFLPYLLRHCVTLP